MIKYFITFVLVAMLALENSSIFNRLHARSHPSSDMRDMSQLVQPHQREQHHHHQLQLLQQPQHHAQHRYKRAHAHPHQHQRQHRREAPRSAGDEFEPRRQTSDKETEALLNYRHVQRHFAQKAEHDHEHRAHYHRQDLRTMPRLWQHLQMDGDRMYGDGTLGSSEEADVEQSLDTEVLLPLNIEEDEGFFNNHSDEENSFNTDPDPDTDPDTDTDTRTLSGPEAGDVAAGESAQAAPSRCPKCESSRKVEHISEEELTRLRIEFVKQQILEKLRLKERPNVSAVGLPKPIYEGTTIEEEDDSAKNKDLDDYYARTSKKFIFLQREKRECKRIGAHPSMCFSFKIDDADADSFDVNTAVLWIFKNKQHKLPKRNHNNNNNNNTMLEQQTIVVSEVQQQLDSKYLPIVKTIAIQSVDVQDEWMKIDIEWPIKRWFGNHDLSHLIHISCQSCDISSMDEMISVDKDYRPFIMVDTQNRRRASRQKRGINCTDGVTECCREKLYISFDDIGWGNWIIQPRGYDAYFCRGSCGSVASVTQSSSHHTTFLQKVLSTRRGVGGKPLELIPCCTAKQYSSLQLVFMDSNNTATQKTFPNMVVESCGCR